MKKIKIHIAFLISCVLLFILNTYSQEIELQFDFGKGGDALPSALLKSAEKAYDFNMKGLDALELGNYDEALEYFNQAIELLPNYSDAMNNKGVVYFRRGYVGLAKELWQKVVKIDPQYAVAWYNLGLVYYNEKNYEAAKQSFTGAIARNKRFVDALAQLGRTNLMLGEVKEAYSNLKKAYKINPSHQGAWGSLAYCMIVMGDTTGAEKILKKHPKNAYALKMLGQIEATRGRRHEAIQYLTEAIARGGDKGIMIDIAQIQFDQGKCKEALKTVESYLLRVSPPSADACLLAGIASKDCGSISDTKKYFERGIQYYPDDPLLRFNLGQVYFYQKDYVNADKTWSFLPDTLSDPSLFYLRAIAARKLDKLNAAEKHIYRSLSLDTKAEYFDLLGVILYAKGKKEDAVIQFNKALALNPSLRSAQLNLAVTGKTKKGISNAIAEMKKQLNTCKSDCEELRFQLSILYYHGMQYENAIKALEKIPHKQKSQRIFRHLALYYRAMADYTRAVAVLEEAQKKFAIDLPLEKELAETYLQAGLYAKAIVVLKDILIKSEENPWRLYYQLGYASVKQNDLETAESYLKKSMKKKKDNVASRSLLAFIYNERGETKKAYNLWDKTLKQDSDNPALWVNKGLILEKEGKYKKAIEAYQKALSVSEGDKSVYVNIGNVYKNIKQLNKAMDAYEQALDSKKRSIAAYNLFITAKDLNEKKKAERAYKLLNNEFPESVNTKRARGEMLLWKGDTSAALTQFEALPQKSRHDWFTLANIYITLGNSEAAENALSRLPRTPEWNKARNLLKARIAYAEGRYKEALAVWKEQSDTSFSEQYNIALTAFKAGEYEAAMQMGKELMERATGPDKAAICGLIGNAAVKLKDWKVAKSWFNRLTTMKPDDAVACYNLAVALFKLNEIENAWEWYQKARNIDPSKRNPDLEKRYKALHEKIVAPVAIDSIDALYNNAVIFQQNGSDTAAEEIYKEIVLLYKRHYRAWNNLGAIYGARGEIDLAIDCYKNAVSRRADIADGYANLVNIYLALEDLKKAQKWLNKGFKHNPDSDVLKQMEKELNKAKINSK